MDVGIIVPQGWTGEFDGWDARAAWERTLAVALAAERLGVESLWVLDHFVPEFEPFDRIMFESYTTLTALAALTRRVRLGHLVASAGFRNPALTAKMICTMDVISGGRMELGIGAGWKEDEWRSFGYGFPPARDRLGALSDQLEVLTRMLGPGPASFVGDYAKVEQAINNPRPVQRPRMPIMVGGNGPNVTWRLAARFADELNVDGMLPDKLGRKLPIIRQRCEEIGRDPADLRVSAHYWWGNAAEPGPARVEHLAAFRELGVTRVISLLPDSAASDEALESFTADAAAAGAALAVA